VRTTLTIDDDILKAARSLADARSASLGSVLSELARKGLECSRSAGSRNGFPVFPVSSKAQPITLEDVKRWEDDQ